MTEHASLPTAPSTRPGYKDIRPYVPDPAVALDLSDNTNRWGAPPAAVRELQSGLSAHAARYPNAYAETLKSALATYVGVDESMIVTGCGSDDVLDSTIRAFGEAGDEVVGLAPSFVMIPSFARMNGLRYTPVPLQADYGIDVDGMTRSEARIIYLCTPNNPTGGTIDRATIETVLERARGIVIVDEAYIEFSGGTAADLVAAYPNLIIARTLSKAWGLAGLRAGYGIAAPATIKEIEKSRGPFKIAAVAERAAAAAVAEDAQWVRERAAEAIASRERLVAQLTARGLAPAPSRSNFVFLPTANASAVARAMRQHGVSVRDMEEVPHFTPAVAASKGGALRITVGPDDEMDRLVAALDAAIGVGAPS